ncbi:hypothetical protein BMS3Abin07_01055 [bacterium BMS3Abin07]|nr:hypothetical protein BMS3Abin07_01055 [bacterium BMS3Abin07]HDO21740.1 hypothetical protein [Nitrospirota bacterium]HDZ87023.1 hypothetical protein [Nitrospirota bacterium]
MKNLKINSLWLAAFVLVLVNAALCANLYAEGTIKIALDHGRINLVAEDRSFGYVLNELSKIAHFTVKIPPDLYSKRISIRLYNTEVDRAVTRLFSLTRERNYRIQYDSSGEITQVDVLKIVKEKSRGTTKVAGRKLDNVNNMPPRYPHRFNPISSAPRRYRPRYVKPE